ncbi:hypothetical protein PISMIDRAFT_283887 [Pisolithus microcarpus 441]|uniref:Uncharacterized protein n=1 Tax=Pisolithus microcarpus 441 TaxID=765257 RepID=A0A0D0A234_9AGAM|nr:hypothetical protein PISMIDRAFT_283887 [Pisolithus microcarpus 441]
MFSTPYLLKSRTARDSGPSLAFILVIVFHQNRESAKYPMYTSVWLQLNWAPTHMRCPGSNVCRRATP